MELFGESTTPFASDCLDKGTHKKNVFYGQANHKGRVERQSSKISNTRK